MVKTVQPAHYRYPLLEWEGRRRQSPIRQTLTVNEVAYFYDKSREGVIKAIEANKLIYRKADAPHGVKGGVYLVEKKSCDQLWGRVEVDVFYLEGRLAEPEQPTIIEPTPIELYIEETTNHD